MQSEDGHSTWGRFVYQELLAPERIVFVNSFSDAEGNVIPPPFEDPWPTEIVNTVTLTEANGRTMVTLRAAPVRATEEEVRVFLAGFDSMAEGYGGTFERLAEVLR